MAGIVVVDAGVLIALYDSSDAHHTAAVQFFIDSVSHQLAIAALTYAELMVHPARAGRADQFENTLAGLHLSVHGLEPADARGLAELRARTSLRMPDAVVLQLALRFQAPLITTDALLAREASAQGCVVQRLVA